MASGRRLLRVAVHGGANASRNTVLRLVAKIDDCTTGLTRSTAGQHIPAQVQMRSLGSVITPDVYVRTNPQCRHEMVAGTKKPAPRVRPGEDSPGMTAVCPSCPRPGVPTTGPAPATQPDYGPAALRWAPLPAGQVLRSHASAIPDGRATFGRSFGPRFGPASKSKPTRAASARAKSTCGQVKKPSRRRYERPKIHCTNLLCDCAFGHLPADWRSVTVSVGYWRPGRHGQREKKSSAMTSASSLAAPFVGTREFVRALNAGFDGMPTRTASRREAVRKPHRGGLPAAVAPHPRGLQPV